VKQFLLPLLLIGCGLSGVITSRAQSNYEPYSFTTVAGLGPGSSNGTGSAARFDFPDGSAVDSAGNVYVADSGNDIIRKITPAGVVSTLAGLAGSSGSADGTGNAARFSFPTGVAVDSAGNVYVADDGNNTIRKITPCGDVSTLAGLAGSTGTADGTGSAARFSQPFGVTVDGAGTIYVADRDNHTIRKITPAGAVSTFAGLAGSNGSADGNGSAARFNFPLGVAVDNAGNVYVADTNSSTVRKITSSGAVSTFAGQAGSFGSADGTGNAARFNNTQGVAVDSAGNVYVADYLNHTIRRITPSRVVSTFAGLAGNGGSADGTGNGARFNFPYGVAVDGAGNAYVADSGNDAIRKITPSRVVTTLAGLAGSFGSADGTGNIARFGFPVSVAADNAGNVYVADSSNHTIRKITPSRIVSTLAGLAGSAGSANGSGSAARFNNPSGVAVDSGGNVYVGDRGNNTIRKITSAGVVSTLAGLAGSSGSTDANGSAARFTEPQGVAVDNAGNVYVTDTDNHTIRKITPVGAVTTLAGLAGSSGSADGTGSGARFAFPQDVAVDSSGNVYVADSSNNAIRTITPAGAVSTLAGVAGTFGSADGIANDARFDGPSGVAVDNKGNVYVAEYFNSTIRKVTSAAEVSTLAGLTGNTGSGDGIGSAARFHNPTGVAVDNAGNVYVADYLNSAIRVGVNAPPVIVTVGQPFVYQLDITGTTSFLVSNLPPGLGFNSQLAAIVGVPTASGTFQVGLSSVNSSGITNNSTLTITVQPTPGSGPIITSSTSATGRVDRLFSFQVETINASSAARLSASGLPPGLSADPVTGVISGTVTGEGSSAVTLTVTDGGFTATASLQLIFTADPASPVILSSNTASLAPGQSFTYTINVPATCDPSDVTTFTLIGTLPAGLFFDPSTGTISGTFTGLSLHSGNGPDVSGGIVTNVQLFATNSHGTSTLPLSFFLAPTGAVNISTRIAVGSGDNVLIGGFIITGNAPKKVVIRAIGPSLKVNGVPIPGAMQDPVLELHDPTGLLGTNDNWRDSQENEIIATDIPPTDEHESAILGYLSPGNYTAVVLGKDGSTGIAVVEVYDLGTASLDQSSNAKLAQISTRGTVLTGDNVMIGGFIVQTSATKVIVRAIGPSLNGIVPGTLQDTVLELHDGSGTTIMSNDDWRTDQEQQIIDTTVPPKDDHESAIVATLNPGAYTAIVRGKNDTTGVALVEVYGLQ
jgi:sugar lactone lactonase YvrE